MSISLVALDIDGTLLEGGHEPTSRVLGAVRALSSAVPVVLATGRRVQSAVPVARSLGLEGTLIALNGGAWADARTGKLLRTEPMGPSVRPLIEAAGRLGLTWSIAAPVGDEEGLFSPFDLGILDLYGDLGRAPGEEHVGQALYFAAWGKRKPLESLRALALRPGDLRVSPVFPSKIRGLMLEAYSGKVGKGQAVAAYARSMGIGREQVVAVGDGHNDVDLLAWAGRGVAMGNGSMAAKAAAGEVIGTCAEDGLAAFIEGLLPEGRAAKEA